MQQRHISRCIVKEERQGKINELFLTKRRQTIVLTLSDTEIQQMKAAVLDADGKESLRMIKEFIRQTEQQKNAGMKSHLNG